MEKRERTEGFQGGTSRWKSKTSTNNTAQRLPASWHGWRSKHHDSVEPLDSKFEPSKYNFVYLFSVSELGTLMPVLISWKQIEVRAILRPGVSPRSARLAFRSSTICLQWAVLFGNQGTFRNWLILMLILTISSKIRQITIALLQGTASNSQNYCC